MLLKISGHEDKKCADLCRHGAPLLGKLPTTRNGNAEKTKQHESLESLFTIAQHGNENILSKLRENPNASELLKMILADAEVGRMTAPRPADQVDLSQVRVSRRLGKPDGTHKKRKKKSGVWTVAQNLDSIRAPRPRST